MKHKWKYIPFSSHHGWEKPENICENCGLKIKDDAPPEEGCLGKVKEIRAIISHRTLTVDQKIILIKDLLNGVKGKNHAK